MYDLYTGYNNNAANKDYKCLSSIKYQLVQGYKDEGTKLQCKYMQCGQKVTKTHI